MKIRIKPMTLALVACLALLAAAPANLHAATITVTNTADGGPGTLREALSIATDGDTVDATAVSGTIVLSSELLLAKSLAILGPGPKNLAVQGAYYARTFHVVSNAVVTISSLAVSGHAFSGGGI